MSSSLRKKGGNAVIWVLMAFLIFGLGGFGISNFGGGVRAIGSVGDVDIDVNDYARALNSEMRAFSAQVGQPVNFATAQTLGLDRKVQAQLFAGAALDNEAAQLGVSVGDAELRKRLLEIPAFKGLDGNFDREAYAQILKQQGMSQAGFEEDVRGDATRALMQGVVAGAIGTPDAFVDTLTRWARETRSFTLAEITADGLETSVPAPTEAEVQAYYEAHPGDFTRPETRAITYVWLSPDMLLDTVEVDEAALRQTYQDRIDEYVTPERRLVERLVYPDEASAATARARLDSGEVDFPALVAERGLTLADIDLGEVTEANLGAAGAAVFALTEPGVVGPLPSDLGPALFAMNGILEAQEVTFEDAREDLASEAKMDRARRVIDDRRESLEDILAGGATLEEVANETEMQLGQIDYAPGTQDGIAAYVAFRDAADVAKPEDFPALVALDDGGVFALHLDEIKPPALRPLDEVRDQAAEGWTVAETHKRLLAAAEAAATAAKGGADLAAQGLTTRAFEDFARDGFVEDAPAAVAQKVFAMPAGESAVVDAEGRVFVLSLTAVTPANTAAEDYKATADAVTNATRQGIAQDLFELYTQAVQDAAGITLNSAAVNAVNAQMQ